MDTCTAESFGIFTGKDSKDYVYYKMMADSKGGRRPMKHILVKNESQIYLENYFPQMIISSETRREKYTLGELTYLKDTAFKNGPAIFRMK
jgi:hypothetical protein